MNVVLWVIQILLAGAYLAAGGAKLATPREKLVANPQMAWTNDFSASAIKAIGAAEVLAAVALILPWALDVAPVLTPLAATGLILLMVGALITHIRRGDPTAPKVATIVLGALALFTAIGRF